MQTTYKYGKHLLTTVIIQVGLKLTNPPPAGLKLTNPPGWAWN
jgi:hypothetical protein